MLSVGILVYPDVEVMDFAGPFEVFSTSNRVQENPKFDVFLVGEESLVSARNGFMVSPRYFLDDSRSIDILLVPGGVHEPSMSNEKLNHWIAEKARQANTVASVCTGVFLLANSGVIVDGPVTTHHEDIEDLRKRFPALDVHSNVRWIDRGDVFVSAGISAGIDMSLEIVAQLCGKEIALKTAEKMEYTWLEKTE
ncbi:DJ-1/PfpI family protein [Sessilibacter corallicola]|uniref:DJ-1/PfpI family protein n=1 Tax=Sessilibacter corallicola TaxID=2904075 RepID=UPI001E340512|nr:DJ-1/PfpI family protein [Sessilibacter corallicola]MCE2026983.1 DJ-1/PfpI family protein [Sessilibacter corallicola]